MHHKEAAVVNAFFESTSPKKILSLATGPARVARETKHFDQGWAVDYSEEMIKEASLVLSDNTTNWIIQKEDAFALSFPDNFFDTVFSFRFLRHFEKKDRERLYQEIKRVLKPEGYLIFEALNENMSGFLFRPRYTGAADKSLYDELYSKVELTKELKDSGFQVVEMLPNLSHGRLYFALTKILGENESLLRPVFKVIDRILPARCFQWEVICASCDN